MTAAKPPADCASMDEVRTEIDRIDAALVDLLAERWRYVDQAWRLKSGPGDAGVQWRNQQVIDKVRARARDGGVPAELTEALWRMIIGWGIQYQMERLRAADDD